MNSKFKKVSTIVKYGIEFELIRSVRQIDNQFIGKWMKEKLTTLGPTFIKIGQFMSTRKDIFGKEFTDELKGLQDNVNPFEYSELLTELNGLENNFASIDKNPIASASIGQVHRAVLKSGEEVVIKARRPNIKACIEDDFQLVLILLDASRNVIQSRRVEEIYVLFEEYYKLLINEIDFKKETQNMKAFDKMFKDTPWLLIPKVYESYCTENIITMQYVPSIKIDNQLELVKYNKKVIADKLMEAFLKQIIDYGLVHIDLHQGNLGMTKNGKIVFYDYGMVLKLDPKIRQNFNTLLFAIYEKDVNEVTKIAIDIDLIVIKGSSSTKNSPEDIEKFKRFIYYLLNYISTLDVNNFKLSYLDNLDQSSINFMLSSKFLMLVRGITILEGICKELDPKFSYMRTLEPYINEQMFNINYFEMKAQKDINKILYPEEEYILVNDKNKNIIVEPKIDEQLATAKQAIVGTISFILLLLRYIK